MATEYRVVAPYVTLKTATDQGTRVVGLYAGATVPDDVTDATLKHHLDAGLIAEVDDDMFMSLPGEPTGPLGRPDSPLDRLDAAGELAALSGATTADPDYAARVAREQGKAPRRAGQSETQRLMAEKAANERAAGVDAAGLPVAPAPAGAAQAEPGETQPPAQSQPKADWVEYAVSQGEDRGKAEGMSKEQLTGKYGKRS